MNGELRRAVLFTLVSMAVVGTYHVGLWSVGRFAFPGQASGSLLRNAAGTVVGSALIAQKFTQAGYFQPRPSAVDYNAASPGGSNLGPSNPDHLTALEQRLDETMAREQVSAADVPSEMITASGAGLDPHIPPDGALIQVVRVAAARGTDAERVRALVESMVEPPQLGFLGRPRVNVLKLNLALDETFGPTAALPSSVSR